MKFTQLFPLTAVLMLGLSGSAYANKSGGESVDALAQELVKLRAQVEDLNADLENKKIEYKSRMAMLVNQRAEIESAVKRESLNIKQLQQSIDKNRGLIRDLGSDSADIKPALFAAMNTVRSYIETSMPFNKSERLKEIDKIREQLSSDVIDAEKAANRLWAFVEDEMRLTNENGIYRQTITIGEREVLVDVAKIGMMMMFFEMPEEGYGQVIREGSDYRYELLTDKHQKENVSVLFESLRKQIRQGYFLLPSASLQVQP